MATTTITHFSVQTETALQENKSAIKYGWWNTLDKAWYISKTKKDFMPKGSRLLLKIEGEYTTSPVCIAGAQPAEGDVVACIDATRILVKNVEYA